MDAKSSITDRLTLALHESGLTQAALGRIVGVTRGAINGWLRGRAVNIRPEHLFAAADALGVEARWLATGKGPMLRQRVADDAADLLESFEALDDDERRAVQLLLHQIADRGPKYKP